MDDAAVSVSPEHQEKDAPLSEQAALIERLSRMMAELWIEVDPGFGTMGLIGAVPAPSW